MSKYKVLLVGCGQLGSRHLQAIASLSMISEIHVVDPNPTSLELGKQRITEISDLNKDILFFWHKSYKDAPVGGDLCIVPTQAKGRSQIVKSVIEHGYKKFFVEKIVAQSVKEYEDLLDFCEKNNMSVWVNCQTRTYEIHKLIRSRLNPEEYFSFANYGGNHGLACNGIHYADLFLFYNGGGEIKSVGSRIDDKLHPSKRGKDVFDLSGTLHACSDSGNDCVISYSGAHASPDYVSIVSPSHKYIIDHDQSMAFESRLEWDWAWKQVPLNEKYSISHMSKKIVAEILTKGRSELPTLQECYPSHKYILDELLPHFNRLLDVKSDSCPVT